MLRFQAAIGWRWIVMHENVSHLIMICFKHDLVKVETSSNGS